MNPIKFKNTASLIAAIGLIASVIGLFFNPRQFFISYLVSFTFWIGLSLGCLAVLMIHHLTASRWGFVTRRFLEAGIANIPLMAVLFIPLLFGLAKLYPWAQPDFVATHEILRRRIAYLNTPGFCLRSIVFLLVWIALSFLVRKNPSRWSGPGLVIYSLTATFAFIDWVMSVEPRWYSTVFLVIMLIGQILSALALITWLLTKFHDRSPFRETVERKQFHDLGNLLLAFVVFWTYVSFSQFLIIYSGNLPRETDWYLCRVAGGWKWVLALLALCHFFIPFFLLLFRVMKQNISRLSAIAALIFIIHSVEVYWTIEPSFFRESFHFHWLDVAAFAGIGGLWTAMFLRHLARHSLLPEKEIHVEAPLIEPAHAT